MNTFKHNVVAENEVETDVRTASYFDSFVADNCKVLHASEVSFFAKIVATWTKRN